MNKQTAQKVLDILKNNQTKITRDENHIYHFEGKPVELVSVSKMLERFALYQSIIDYTNGIKQTIETPFSKIAGVKSIKAKATAGTNIHDLVDKKTESTNTASQMVNEFLSQRIHLNETKLVDFELKIVGEFDGMYFNEDSQKLVMFDIKTGRMVNLTKFNNQLKQYLSIVCNNKEIKELGVTPKDFAFSIFKFDKQDNGDYLFNEKLFKEISFSNNQYGKTIEMLKELTSEKTTKVIEWFEKDYVEKQSLLIKETENKINDYTLTVLDDILGIKENFENKIEALKSQSQNELLTFKVDKKTLTKELQELVVEDVISGVELEKIICSQLEQNVMKQANICFNLQAKKGNIAFTGKIGKGYVSEKSFYSNIVSILQINNPGVEINFSKEDLDKCKSEATTCSRKINLERIS